MKKVFCMVLAIVMVLTVTAVADSSFAGGNGTKEDPWQVATADQLNLIRENLSGHYILTADIDLSGYENWEPIGAFQSLPDAPEDAEVPHPDYAFTGTFDGAGHTISNMKVSAASPMGAGLFGCATGTENGEAYIGNFTLEILMFQVFIWLAEQSAFSL